MIAFSYGAPKSASTYCFQITQDIASAAGFEQSRLSVRETLRTITGSIQVFETWLSCPQVHFVSYDDVLKRPYELSNRLARQLGVEVPVIEITDRYRDTSRIVEFNIGREGRYRELFTSDELKFIQSEIRIFHSIRRRQSTGR